MNVDMLVISGVRPKLASHSSLAAVERLMLSAWSQSPHSRPSAAHIAELFEKPQTVCERSALTSIPVQPDVLHCLKLPAVVTKPTLAPQISTTRAIFSELSIEDSIINSPTSPTSPMFNPHQHVNQTRPELDSANALLVVSGEGSRRVMLLVDVEANSVIGSEMYLPGPRVTCVSSDCQLVWLGTNVRRLEVYQVTADRMLRQEQQLIVDGAVRCLARMPRLSDEQSGDFLETKGFEVSVCVCVCV